MSRSTASAGSASSEPDWAAAAASRFRLPPGAARAVGRRLTGPKAALAVLACSPAAWGDDPGGGVSGITPTEVLLDWVGRWDPDTPRAVLAIAGRKYVSVSGLAGSYDADADEVVGAVPFNWADCRLLNLDVVFHGLTSEGSQRA